MSSRDLILFSLTRRPSLVIGTHSLSSSRGRPRPRPRPRPRSPRPLPKPPRPGINDTRGYGTNSHRKRSTQGGSGRQGETVVTTPVIKDKLETYLGALLLLSVGVHKTLRYVRAGNLADNSVLSAGTAVQAIRKAEYYRGKEYTILRETLPKVSINQQGGMDILMRRGADEDSFWGVLEDRSRG